MAYTFPYCTFDKLRISNANGIKFRYLTGEGSFFEGETIQDNTFYNDDSNCGFAWEAFAQKIPCDGTIRLQFQWCDTNAPVLHIFQNEEFVIDINPSKVYSGEFDIYEVELNFGSESDFCNSCIDLRITSLSTYQYNLISKTNNDLLVGIDNSYQLISIDPSETINSMSIYDVGVIFSSINGSETKIYSLIGYEVSELYVTSTGHGSFIKAFDALNWVAVNNGNGNIIISINGTITEETLPFVTYFYGIDGVSINEIYAISKNPASPVKIIKRSGGVWTEHYDFLFSWNLSNSRYSFKYFGGKLYAIGTFLGNTGVSVFDINTNTNTLTDFSTESPSCLDISTSIQIACTQQEVYFYNGASWVKDTSFDTIRAENSDAFIITSCHIIGENALSVLTQGNVYNKIEGNWSIGGIGDYYSGEMNQVVGIFTSQFNYHAQSEPIRIGAVDCLIPIEYWNIDDYDGQYFCDGFRNIVYIEAQFIKYSPIETSSVYVTSNNVKRVLSKNIAKKRQLDINYIPEYLHDIVTIAFSMDNLLINGKSFTAESEYKILDNNSLYSLSKASIEVYENLYKFENSNCNNECGGNEPASPACVLPDSEGFWGGNAEI